MILSAPRKISFKDDYLGLQIYVDPRMVAKAEKLLREFPEEAYQAYQRGVFRFARQVLAIVRKAFNTGMPPEGSGVSWPPLSPETLKQYEKWGYSTTTPYNLTGQIRKKVNMFKNSRNLTYVGLPRGEVAINPKPKKKGETEGRPTLAKLVSWLEAGSDWAPPRPIFNPAYKAAGGNTRLEKFIIQELRKAVRRLVQ